MTWKEGRLYITSVSQIEEWLTTSYDVGPHNHDRFYDTLVLQSTMDEYHLFSM